MNNAVVSSLCLKLGRIATNIFGNEDPADLMVEPEPDCVQSIAGEETPPPVEPESYLEELYETADEDSSLLLPPALERRTPTPKRRSIGPSTSNTSKPKTFSNLDSNSDSGFRRRSRASRRSSRKAAAILAFVDHDSLLVQDSPAKASPPRKIPSPEPKPAKMFQSRIPRPKLLHPSSSAQGEMKVMRGPDIENSVDWIATTTNVVSPGDSGLLPISPYELISRVRKPGGVVNARRRPSLAVGRKRVATPAAKPRTKVQAHQQHHKCFEFGSRDLVVKKVHFK